MRATLFRLQGVAAKEFYRSIFDLLEFLSRQEGSPALEAKVARKAALINIFQIIATSRHVLRHKRQAGRVSLDIS